MRLKNSHAQSEPRSASRDCVAHCLVPGAHSYLLGSAFQNSLFCRLRPASLYTCCCPRWSSPSPGSLIYWSVHLSWDRISSNGLSWLLTLPNLNFSSGPLQSRCFHCNRGCTFISDVSWISHCRALALDDSFTGPQPLCTDAEGVLPRLISVMLVSC